jgi:hypothetical protein
MGTLADLGTCCESLVAQGCLSNGDAWVLADHGDGTFTLYNAFTGDIADPLDIVDCPAEEAITTFQDHFLATPWSTQAQITGLGTLVSWEVKCITQPVTLQISGHAAFAMDLDEVVSFAAQDDRRLDDLVVITISGVGRAHITTVRKGVA